MYKILLLLFSFVLLLSPCSIKSSIHEIVQAEYSSVEKTSPNKAIYKSFQKCSTSNAIKAAKGNVKEVKLSLLPDYNFTKIFTPNAVERAVFEKAFSSETSTAKLYVLYSCLKISA